MKLVSLIIAILLCSYVTAQEMNPNTVRLSLLDCITTALEQSPDMAGPNEQVALAKISLLGRSGRRWKWR